MDGWSGRRCHVSPTLDDHVGVNVIRGFVTMMKWRKGAYAVRVWVRVDVVRSAGSSCPHRPALKVINTVFHLSLWFA